MRTRLKLTTWNAQHAERLLREPPSREVLERRARVRRTVREMAPDILCIQEGPRGEQGVLAFAERVLDGTGLAPVLLDPPAAWAAGASAAEVGEAAEGSGAEKAVAPASGDVDVDGDGDGDGADRHNDRVCQQKGRQWIWFFVDAELAVRCGLQPPTVWQAYAGERSWTLRYWNDGDAS